MPLTSTAAERAVLAHFAPIPLLHLLHHDHAACRTMPTTLYYFSLPGEGLVWAHACPPVTYAHRFAHLSTPIGVLPQLSYAELSQTSLSTSQQSFGCSECTPSWDPPRKPCCKSVIPLPRTTVSPSAVSRIRGPCITQSLGDLCCILSSHLIYPTLCPRRCQPLQGGGRLRACASTSPAPTMR